MKLWVLEGMAFVRATFPHTERLNAVEKREERKRGEASSRKNQIKERERSTGSPKEKLRAIPPKEETRDTPPSTRRAPRAVTAAMWVSRGSTAKGPRGSTGTAERQSRCAHLGQRRNGVCAMRTPGRSPLTKLLTFRHPVAARLSSY